MARCGPQLRSPSGGYLAAATNWRASVTLLIIGATIASAPMSSARDVKAKSASGTRTAGVEPARCTAPMPVTIEAVSHRPCCCSSMVQAKPSRAIVSATIGEPRLHQAEKTVSPARRRRARPKAGTSATRLDLCGRLFQEFVHGAADLEIGDGDLLVVEAFADFLKNIAIAAFLEVRQDHFLREGLRTGAGQPKLGRRPQAHPLIAARAGLELELLIMRELLFEAFLALLETAHAAPLNSHTVFPRKNGSAFIVSCTGNAT